MNERRELTGAEWAELGALFEKQDARYCAPEESRRVGEAPAKIQSHYLSPDANPEGCRAYFAHRLKA